MSVYLSSILIAFVVAQGLKFLIHWLKDRKLANIHLLYQSGNMPSGHTSVVGALLVVVGWYDGTASVQFAIVATLALIVAYDATQVRRATGEQGLAIRQLLERANIIEMPYHALGHRPIEVAGGAVVGLVVGVSVIFFTSIM